jgi:hypothetical protein
MGYLESVTRGDGDVESFGSDLLGRVTYLKRNFEIGSTATHDLAYSNETGSGVNTGSALPTRVTDPAPVRWRVAP